MSLEKENRSFTLTFSFAGDSVDYYVVAEDLSDQHRLEALAAAMIAAAQPLIKARPRPLREAV